MAFLSASRAIRCGIVAANVLVLVVTVVPFAAWEGFGPQRFEELALGVAPSYAPVEPLPRIMADAQDLPAASGEPAEEADFVGALPYDLSPTTSVTLVFSVGSRDLDRQEAARLRVDDLDLRGADGLTDSIMLLVADRATRQAALLSVPRDLWMFDRGHRINESFNRHGTQALVDDVSHSTGLPIHHVVRVNFAAFAELVDAIGGVAVPTDRALADLASVLYVPAPGCWLLDGAGALAFVRSRQTLTRDQDGDWTPDGSASDFGRMSRQRALLGAVWDQVRTPASLGRVPGIVTAARNGLVVDQRLGLQQVRDLAATFADLSAGRVEGFTLPTENARIGRAAALVYDQAAAADVLTRLRTWPPDVTDPPPGEIDEMDLPLPVDISCTPEVATTLPGPRDPLGVIRNGGDPAR